MKHMAMILGLFLLGGCASTEAIYKNYAELVKVSDGVDEREAKIIAQRELIKYHEKRDYRITAPDIQTTMAAKKFEDYWFVVFGHNWLSPISTDPMAKTFTELKETQYLVVIAKKDGTIKYTGTWYPKRADSFDWIFDPDSFRREHALGLFPGEASRPGI